MSTTRKQYDEQFKKNAVKQSYESSKAVAQVARDLGISSGMLYRWRIKYALDAGKPQYATLQEENKQLRLRNAQQSAKLDLLQKIAAHFANLLK